MAVTPSVRAAAYEAAASNLDALLTAAPRSDTVHDAVARVAALLLLLVVGDLHGPAIRILRVLAEGIPEPKESRAADVRASVGAELSRLGRSVAPEELPWVRQVSGDLLAAWAAHEDCVGCDLLRRVIAASSASAEAP